MISGSSMSAQANCTGSGITMAVFSGTSCFSGDQILYGSYTPGSCSDVTLGGVVSSIVPRCTSGAGTAGLAISAIAFAAVTLLATARRG